MRSKFLREVGSIVLGVLIAIGIGEVAEGVRHRSNAAAAIGAVREEMAGTALAIEERMMKGRCIVRRLEGLRTALASARETGRMVRIAEIGRPNRRALTQVAWSNFIGSDDFRYGDPTAVADARNYYTSLDSYAEVQQHEQLLWAKLRVLENRVDVPDENLMAELELSIEEARYDARLLNTVARQLWTVQQYLGVATDYARYTDMSRARMIRWVRSTPLCRPI